MFKLGELLNFFYIDFMEFFVRVLKIAQPVVELAKKVDVLY